MNNFRTFSVAITALFLVVNSKPSFSQDMPVTEETVSLELGVTDSQQYGRGYGRDGNENRLDVSFTAIEALDHRLSWQLFDIERNEMLIFLNDVQIRTAITTNANQLGGIDGITILSSDLNSGTNVLSFRTEAGDETWGVTNLLAESIAAVVDGEAATTVLLDAPDQDGPAFGGSETTTFTFDFSPRGDFYSETITINFDSYVASGGVNGFELSLNGRLVKRVSNYRGRANFITQTVVLDKTQIVNGQNTFTIRITTPGSGSFIDAGFANVEVLNSSVPLLDVSVNEVSVSDRGSDNGKTELAAIVDNIGAKTSPSEMMLIFSVSSSEDMSQAQEIARTQVVPISGASSATVTQLIENNDLVRARYLSACIDRLAEDLDASNDCSPAIAISGAAIAVTPAVILLLDD